MVIYTDNIEHAETTVLPKNRHWEAISSPSGSPISPLIDTLFTGSSIYKSSLETSSLWQYLSVVKSAPRSQYDIVNELCKNNIRLPHGILCLAGEGEDFHGFKDRPWSSPPGNIYLTAYFAPCQPIDHFGIGFIILAAISVVDTIDAMPELTGKAGIKWVNDVLIEGAKVSGVLAYTQQEGDNVTSATLGIGLNLNTTPEIEPSPFVPRAASLADFWPGPKYHETIFVFNKLITALSDNYKVLLTEGYRELLRRYRDKSLIIGREVEICSDIQADRKEVLAEGIVTHIGDNLELHLEGRDRPITRGRLALKS